MKKLLKFINSMPFSFGMKHYQVFGEATRRMKDGALISPESWDALREDHPFFSIATDRATWLAASEAEIEKDGQDAGIKRRAADIVTLLRERGISRVFSVGAGGAALEYQIKKLMPEISLVCSDYSPVTVGRLQQVFTEADGIIQFDIMKGDWQKVRESYIGEDGVCLMYRLDAGFSDAEWQSIFERMSQAKVRNILVIPTGVLTLLSIYNRKKRELGWFLQGTARVFCGYLRTKRRFHEQWSAWYGEEEMLLGGLRSFFLRRKQIPAS